MMSQSRFENFTDGALAIIVTLLAIELSAPILNSSDMFVAWNAISKLLPHFALFFLSFITIIIMWENHHAITTKIEKINQKIFWSNSFLLMFMALVPFATSFLGHNPTNKLALITYCFIMFCISFCFSKYKKNVLGNNDNKYNKPKAPRHVGIYIYSFAIIVTFISLPLAYLLLIIPLIFYLLPQQMTR